MEYTVKALAQLAGVTPRTLRWYDARGLLKPGKVTGAGYRLYGPEEVDRLQQILFYRELGLPLREIGAILDDPAFDRRAALQSHLKQLQQRQVRLGALIETVERTLLDEKGEYEMTDQEKFEGFKRRLVEENEARFGKEARALYGDTSVEESGQAIKEMTREEFDRWQCLDQELREGLEKAVRAGAVPGGAEGKRLAKLHREWLTCTVKPYDPKRHAGIAMLYVQDKRFTDHYDKNCHGCARFLRDAVLVYTKSL